MWAPAVPIVESTLHGSAVLRSAGIHLDSLLFFLGIGCVGNEIWWDFMRLCCYFICILLHFDRIIKDFISNYWNFIEICKNFVKMGKVFIKHPGATSFHTAWVPFRPGGISLKFAEIQWALRISAESTIVSLKSERVSLKSGRIALKLVGVSLKSVGGSLKSVGNISFNTIGVPWNVGPRRPNSGVHPTRERRFAICWDSLG